MCGIFILSLFAINTKENATDIAAQQALNKLGANDKNPNGLFTRMLLSEMKAPSVSVDNMIRGVRRKVVEAAKSVGHYQV